MIFHSVTRLMPKCLDAKGPVAVEFAQCCDYPVPIEVPFCRQRAHEIGGALFQQIFRKVGEGYGVALGCYGSIFECIDEPADIAGSVVRLAGLPGHRLALYIRLLLTR